MTEEHIHRRVCRYLKLQYPKVMFSTDLSGIKLPIGLAKKIKNLKSHRGYPDLMIFEPRKGFHGLFIELKDYDSPPYKKNGELRKNPHLQEQAEIIRMLKKRNYQAHFATGDEQAMDIIDKYLKEDKQ